MNDDMRTSGAVWTADALRAAVAASGEEYAEFLRFPSMSGGLYVLAAGADDTQEPHAEDEVYVVLSGRGSLECNGVTRPISVGDTLFVPALVDHRFIEITERLELLVFFAPAEGTNA